MIPLSLREVAALVDGRRADVPDELESALITGPVVVDSREVQPGSLFVALPGEKVDGHAYTAQAMASGATAVLAAHPVGVPAIVVADPVEALGRLARGVLERLSAPVVGITGSSGKTSTKDLLAQVLSRLGPTVAPPGSFNNEIGLPLTVLRADPTTRSLVLEFGARGVGHIRTLTEIAPPRIGVVLNVGSAHLGEFGSREAVAKAKGELVEALPTEELGGVAVLNADDPLVLAMAERTQACVLTFGRAAHADIRAEDVTLDELGRASFNLVFAPALGGHSAPVQLQLYGEHHVSNALAAAAAASALGLPVGEIALGLREAVALSRWRMEVSRRVDDVIVINDAYNANPESMRAALTAHAKLAGDRRRWAVLGEMRELGPEAETAHEELGREVVARDVARLVVVGSGAEGIHAGASTAIGWAGRSVLVADAAAAIELLREHVAPGDVVLVKASRAVELERVADALLVDGVVPLPATATSIPPAPVSTPAPILIDAPADAAHADAPDDDAADDNAVDTLAGQSTRPGEAVA